MTMQSPFPVSGLLVSMCTSSQWSEKFQNFENNLLEELRRRAIKLYTLIVDWTSPFMAKNHLKNRLDHVFFITPLYKLYPDKPYSFLAIETKSLPTTTSQAGPILDILHRVRDIEKVIRESCSCLEFNFEQILVKLPFLSGASVLVRAVMTTRTMQGGGRHWDDVKTIICETTKQLKSLTVEDFQECFDQWKQRYLILVYKIDEYGS
ncbi:hypothetical protein NQ317_004420 [Molorchus minor]|uniref:Uncharacterized protein n=1 Tax=Molorchus minor TaxID=1323400 RepID=A0ABQ9JM95_9CUCU|nr:hypothetical protein NQ317_004420 [Molorchus minor]